MSSPKRHRLQVSSMSNGTIPFDSLIPETHTPSAESSTNSRPILMRGIFIVALLLRCSRCLAPGRLAGGGKTSPTRAIRVTEGERKKKSELSELRTYGAFVVFVVCCDACQSGHKMRTYFSGRRLFRSFSYPSRGRPRDSCRTSASSPLRSPFPGPERRHFLRYSWRCLRQCHLLAPILRNHA